MNFHRNRYRPDGKRDNLESSPTGDHAMKKKRIPIILIALFTAAVNTNLRADWKSDWEKVIEAAKREGRLNLYVGRYGQEPLLEEFKKEYPEIKVVTVNGTGEQLATRILAEARGG